ncbi:hypothetical protein LCGC14_2803630 [marine sediment metagenome]|uniref:Uncharacterized protein n=1 Tax=marine sediment metagenome TaxID=412755 RepID=A0A0F8YM15_9ZZZZ
MKSELFEEIYNVFWTHKPFCRILRGYIPADSSPMGRPSSSRPAAPGPMGDPQIGPIVDPTDELGKTRCQQPRSEA